jgi:hypothetical protein
VDVSVTRHARVYCGSGRADVDMAVAVADILQHTGAQVVDVAAGCRQAAQLQAAAAEEEAAALLPVPWAPGAGRVRLVGVVAQRRRCGAGRGGAGHGAVQRAPRRGRRASASRCMLALRRRAGPRANTRRPTAPQHP